MTLEKYSRRYVSKADKDLLVIYTRVNGEHALFDDRDGLVAISLVEDFKKSAGQKLKDRLTIQIHSQGGDLIHAIKLASYLQSYYKEIDTVVFNVAKSCMSLLSLAGKKLYLGDEAGISDFSINMNEKLTFDEFKRINKAELGILYNGVLSTEGNDSGVFKDLWENLFFSRKDHGTTIPFSDAKKMLPHSVFRLEDLGIYIFHLSSIHSLLLHQFDDRHGIYKTIGFNGKFVNS